MKHSFAPGLPKIGWNAYGQKAKFYDVPLGQAVWLDSVEREEYTHYPAGTFRTQEEIDEDACRL